MEQRKRPHVESPENDYPKKRAALDSNGTPSHVNGVSHLDEPKDGDNLEMFRKEAIFRRMKYYSRESERCQSRIAELERQKSRCEAGLAAMETCWQQLIDVIGSLVKPEQLPSIQPDTRQIFDLSRHVPNDSEDLNHLTEAFNSRLQATEKLVSAFISICGKGTSGFQQEDLLLKYHAAQSEAKSLHSQLAMLRSQLSEATTQKERYLNDLVLAQSRVDRLSSKTVQAMAPSPKVNGDPVKPDSPVHDVGPDSEEAEEALQAKQKELDDLQVRFDQLQDKQTAPSDAFISKSPHYVLLLSHASKLDFDVKRGEKKISELTAELEVLRKERQDLEVIFTTSKEQEFAEVVSRLKKRDVDNARLREQRDQLQAELTERKHLESVKLSSANEMKVLADSRSERIAVLQSELRRLRARLTAQAGDEDLMSFILNQSDVDINYIQDLKTRLEKAEATVKGFQGSLLALQTQDLESAKCLEAEAAARTQVVELQKQLESYQTVCGQSGDALKQLEEKESELKKLRLQVTQHAQAETALYTELERLSTAWEALDKEVKNKLFDLAAVEDRLSKSAVEKAKSENKFYSAMRGKEAIENERKNLIRNLEKQAKVVEKLMASESSLREQLNLRDQSIQVMQEAIDFHIATIQGLMAGKLEYETRSKADQRKAEDIGSKWTEQVKLTEKYKSEVSRLEGLLARKKSELERQNKVKGAPTSVKEAQLQGEVDKCMSLLKCSTCKLNLRTTVLTKCMHTFCKQCVDARISTRQRKCPACNLAFGQGDVQQLYFQ
ncbi:BRE1-domain-containing protein [Thelephora ganbajun]|uniref:BRE1-domain-containing protein n=1 Tax=Thelephora ganbajun TaxID=370292 RepID=A0ACB6ZWA3_THEGA|nr:BRE1-domain-containing protein [Thelephora ganbajun]